MSKSIFLPFCLEKQQLDDLVNDQKQMLEDIGVLQIFQSYLKYLNNNAESVSVVDKSVNNSVNKSVDNSANKSVQNDTESITTDKSQENDKITVSQNITTTKQKYTPVGLYNIENSCYMNSALQCLFATKKLREYFLNKYSEDKNNLTQNKMVETYHKLLQKVVSKQVQYNDLKTFKNGFTQEGKYFQNCYKEFNNYEQMDSMEFLQCLIYKLNVDFCPSSDDKLYESKKEDSIINEVFYIKIAEVLSHKDTCQEKRYKMEHQINFITQISGISKDRKNIEEYLEQTFKLEMLDNPSNSTCQDCGQIYSEKQKYLYELPDVFIIQLCVFGFENSEQYKIQTSIDINFDIDLSKYVIDTSLKKVITDDKENQNQYEKDSIRQIKNTKYKLYGIIRHSGEQTKSGHYISQVCDDEDQWWDCNDASVQKIQSEDINNNKYQNFTPYILFYQRDI